jgi:hypothetical protein
MARPKGVCRDDGGLVRRNIQKMTQETIVLIEFVLRYQSPSLLSKSRVLCASKNLSDFDVCVIPREAFSLCVESTLLLGNNHRNRDINRDTKNQRRTEKRDGDELHPFLVNRGCFD